jgi:hypothetical protein
MDSRMMRLGVERLHFQERCGIVLEVRFGGTGLSEKPGDVT